MKVVYFLYAHWQGIWNVGGVVFGTLFGAWIGSRMNNRNWVRENKRRDYQDVLTALVKGYEAAAYMRSGSAAFAGPQYQKQWYDMSREAQRTLEDRLFIADDLKKLRIKERWSEAKEKFQNNANLE